MSLLDETERQKLDDRPDERFYDQPRLVTHADDGFHDSLTAVYDEYLDPGDDVFDAMGSWVSHLPDTDLGRVVGHGLNAAELRENDRYTEWFVQDFNDDRRVPLSDASVDAVTCALSVQYLQYPGTVFDEFARVLRPDGVLVVSFTNRMFPTKAVRAWRTRSTPERLALVERYVDHADLTVERTVHETPETDPLCVVVGRKSRRS
ncbi:class I SAM-dependent methyltransferase [Halobaculum sp. MBLA0147]|uniref:class I SAM-dependent methyltransferase n=1 Tax=Halobaculum sp. MBLA0147 TaxID=3079934 RepID=UPI003523752A